MIATSCYKENVDCRYVQCIGLSLQLLQIYNNIKPLSIAYGQKFQYFQVNVCCLSAILVLLNPYKSESLYFFITNGGDAWDLTSVLLYMFGMLSSYIFSTLYHACSPDSKWRKTLRKLDHSAIYWHIAGSYSPITLIAMRDTGYWGWGIFIFCWLCAIVGTSLSLYSLKKHNILETVCYILMGLTILVATKQFYDAVALPVFLWVVGEGVAYITGAVFYSFHKVKYIHTVFHFFVLLGTACHMIAMWYVIKGM